jgi:hypothetical protein
MLNDKSQEAPVVERGLKTALVQVQGAGKENTTNKSGKE